MTLLCQLPNDRPLHDEHLDTCPGKPCRGCMPKPADQAQNLLCCVACRIRVTDRVLELPELAEELLTPSRVRGGGTTDTEPQDDTPATLAELPSPLGDDAIDLRTEIRRLWVRWADILMSDLFPQVRRPDGWTLHQVVDHWALFLLGHEQTAVDFAGQVDDLWTRALHRARPLPPPGQLLGECPTCGTPVRSDRLIGEVTCRGCHTTRTVEEWTRVFVGDLTASTSATGGDLLAWLSARHQRTISPDVLRQWAARGVRIPQPDGTRTLVRLERLGQDGRGRTLYSVPAAAAIAHQLYGTTQIGA